MRVLDGFGRIYAESEVTSQVGKDRLGAGGSQDSFQEFLLQAEKANSIGAQFCVERAFHWKLIKIRALRRICFAFLFGRRPSKMRLLRRIYKTDTFFTFTERISFLKKNNYLPCRIHGFSTDCHYLIMLQNQLTWLLFLSLTYL